jgi:predicted kinase
LFLVNKVEEVRDLRVTNRAKRRYLIMVSGAPGAGKTTLAQALASELDLPLYSKDRLKETLIDTLGGPTQDMEYSRRLGGTAMELLWRLAAQAPAAIIEANFRPHSEYERGRLAALGAAIIELHCDCPPSEVARRFASRAAAGAHAAHPLTSLSPELWAEYDCPVGVGVVIPVDTTRPVEIAAVAAEVRRRLPPWSSQGNPWSSGVAAT